MTETRTRTSGEATVNRLAPERQASRPNRSTAKGDVPEALLDRYLVERDRRGRAERFFRDHRASEPLFRDRGGSLVADTAYPDAVVDMLKIAQHRGWTKVRVSGDAAFKREVWIQAQALDLEVAGHRPGERDRQAAGQDRPPPRSDRGDIDARLARAAVVVRRLIADPAAQIRLLQEAAKRAGRSADRDRPQGRERTR